MTNAWGYANNRREEYIANKFDRLRLVDINRDFPYNTEERDCMNTIAGRVLYKLFASNLFVSSITFHGGTEVISYPWGSNNMVKEWGPYKAWEAPDHVALHQTGLAMKQSAGGNYYIGEYQHYVKDYVLGDMTETVYPVGGGLEDWAYAAGWEKGATLPAC